MSNPRSLANHARYLAAIQLESWEAAMAAGGKPAWVINAAFAPAVQQHLRVAYGWLLLAAARVTAPPAVPPSSVAELPLPVRGLTLPVEVEHCRALETDGWLAELLTPMPLQPQPKGSAGLLASTAFVADIDRCARWCEQFDQLINAVDHAIDES